jgi:hypothetical protein
MCIFANPNWNVFLTMNLDKQHIESLCRAVEHSAGHSVSTSGDFIRLSGQIEGRLGETLGISTLKRVWGKVGDGEQPRMATLNLLAQFCGHADYQAFVADVCGEDDYATSHRIIVTAINTDNLKKGALLILEWNPDRKILIEHLNKGHFKVCSSQNSKLQVGDTFHCDRMLPGQPCYLDHLTHDGDTSPYYVMGIQGGLTKIEQVQEL